MRFCSLVSRGFGRISRWVCGAYEFGGTVWLDYVDDNGNLVAAALSFYLFLSLIPMLVLGVAIGGYLLGSPARAEEIVLSLVKSGAPGLVAAGWLDSVRAAVDEVVTGRRLATGFGLLTLLWIGTTLFGCLEQAINVAWGLGQRQFVRKRVLALVTLFLMWLLLGISFVITTALTAIRWNEIGIFGVSPSDWPWVVTLVGYVVPVSLSVVTFTLLYHLMPNVRVPWKVAAAGGVFAGVLWEMGKLVFSFYLSRFANYSAVYGSLAGIIVLLIWIYFSSIITIMGAEVASVYAGRRELREKELLGG